VGLAEMGDKTQLSILILSTRTKEYFRLLLGVMLAFLLTDGLAILLGSYVGDVMPVTAVKALSGLVFILFGILILKNGPEDEEAAMSHSSRSAFISGFSMIFLSEWGDKTQIASALFATEYDPHMVLTGVMMALFLLSLMAIYLGRYLSSRIDRKLLSRAAGAIFLIIGSYFLLSALASSL